MRERTAANFTGDFSERGIIPEFLRAECYNPACFYRPHPPPNQRKIAMRTICVSPDFPLNRRMRKAILRGKLHVVREGENGSANTIAKSHIWRPIEDMPAKFSQEVQAAEEELRLLTRIWREQKAEFDKRELDKFTRELNREWSIETGLIERAYHLERGTTRILIQQGLKEGLIPHRNGQDPTEVAKMLRDHENVIDSLLTGGRELSVGYVKDLHAEMLRAQKTVVGVDQFGNKTRIPMNHGVFKKRSNNPFTSDGKLHEYCPPEQTDSEMDRLMEMHKKHSAHSPLARAAWLHHRFVQIHPFEDGNGRVARCLATLALIRAGLFPLVVLNEDREKYLDALDDANRGDLSPLLCHFAEWQKRYFIKALGIAGQVWGEIRREKIVTDRAHYDAPADSSLEAQINSLASFMARKGRQQQIALAEQLNTAIKTAEVLYGIAYHRLDNTAKQLAGKLGDDGDAWADWAAKDEEKGHYFRYQIVATARKLEYYANTDVHRAWARLALRVADERAILLLFFHGIGRPYRGVIACSACFVMRRPTEGDENQGPEPEPEPLGNGVFQINYQEEEMQAIKRFEPWLDEIIQSALARAQEEF